jgi:diguanylate cyclase (GGDEF)-like protein
LAGRHIGGTVTRLALELVRDRLGDGAILATLGAAGEERPAGVLLDDGSWSSYPQARRLLEACAAALGGPEELASITEVARMDAGSMPEATGALQQLGSPHPLLRDLAGGRSVIITILEHGGEQTGESEWVLRSRFREGYEPFPEWCAINRGLLAMVPRLFGFPHATVLEETCQCRGGQWCTMRVRWDETDDTARTMEFLRSRVGVLERRLEAFHATIADLVSAEELDSVLRRIVSSAARTARLPGFVLALRPLGYVRCATIYTEGISTEEAIPLADLVLSGRAGEVPGITVEVASTRRSYGYLVAVDPSASGMPRDRPAFESYARLAATALDSASALDAARREAETSHALLELAGALATIATTEQVAETLARVTPDVVDCDAAAVVLFDVVGGTARIAAAYGFPPGIQEAIVSVVVPLRELVPEGVQVVERHEATDETSLLMQLTEVAAIATVQLRDGADPIGCLVAAVRDAPERLAEAEQDLRLRGLAAQASTAMRNAQLVEQLRHQALHDPLTGLPNRKLLLDRAEQLVWGAQRTGIEPSVLYLDLDGFKEVNEAHGHAAGDELLCLVAERLGAVIRAGDTLARIGGDEFIVICATAEAGGPEALAARLLTALEAPIALTGAGVMVRVSASIGIATGSSGGTDALLQRADQALFRAKAAGKGCWVVAGDEAPGAPGTFIGPRTPPRAGSKRSTPGRP